MCACTSTGGGESTADKLGDRRRLGERRRDGDDDGVRGCCSSESTDQSAGAKSAGGASSDGASAREPLGLVALACALVCALVWALAEASACA